MPSVGPLSELAVSDLALIERIRVRFRPGFVVITGETGAGKSLLIDALGLVMGGRADASLIRAGAGAARIEALFERSPEPLICVREVTAARSIARIDDETVTAGRLAERVGPLVEIHGQHEHTRLLSSARQRDLLDAYGGHRTLRDEVGAAVEAWRANRAALGALRVDPAERERHLELHEHAAREIAEAAPRPGEVEELRSALARASDAGRIRSLLSGIRDELSGEGRGARDALARSARSARELARLDERHAPLAARLEGLVAEVEDAAEALRSAVADDDPRPVEALEERLGVLYGLFRKYGQDEEAVLAHGDLARGEAERLRGLESESRAREADDARLLRRAQEAAARLRDARGTAARDLSEAVSEAVRDLGFGAAAFSVALREIPLDATGSDGVEFLFAPNPGEPPLPLARIASGGELSRVALAIKDVLAAADGTPTLVFDEVDSGIGGRSADPVGRRLRRLARSHQVICVTHLPQIAAYADQHFRIEKRTTGGRTVTEVRELEGDERLHELSAMLGGSARDAGALAGARELLERATATIHAEAG